MKYRVCIIEDEDIIRKGLIRSVNWEAVDCVVVGEASNGEEGYKLIEKAQPDIIIVDINMPLMNGIQLLEKLPRDIYSVIIISGHTEFSYAKSAIEYGVSEYLLKPLDTQELERSLIRAVQKVQMLKNYMKSNAIPDTYSALQYIDKVDSVSLSKALVYIDDNYMNKITLEDLKTVTGIATTSIASRFQKHLSMTFNEYLTRYRIQKSLDLMKEQDMHLYEISEVLGFHDYKYFNTVFKKTMGVSPKIVMTYYARIKVKE